MSRYIVSIVLTAIALSGCASYQPMPLTDQAVAERLSGPDMKDIRIKASQIKHPILKSIEFNDRDGLSPDEAAILAVLVNPRLRAIRDGQAIANSQLIQAKLLPNPQLSYSMDFPTGGNTDGTVNAFGLGLDWDVSSLIAHQQRIDTAKAHTDSVNLEIAWQEWQVAEAAKLGIYRLVIAKKRLVLAKQIKAEREKALKATTNAVEIGERNSLDLSVSNNAVEQAKLILLKASDKEHQEQFALNSILGLSAGKVIPLQQDISLPLWQNIDSAAKAASGIENRRLDLLALKAGYQSQEAKVRAAVKSQFPRINIGLASQRDTDDLKTTGFGVGIELPFFDQNQGRIAIERATRQQLFDEYTLRLFDAQSKIASISSSLQYTRDQIGTIKASIPTLNHMIHSYEVAVKTGNADILSYYHILDDLYKKKFELLELENRQAQLSIAFEITSGRYLPNSNRTVKKEITK